MKEVEREGTFNPWQAEYRAARREANTAEALLEGLRGDPPDALNPFIRGVDEEAGHARRRGVHIQHHRKLR